MSSINAKNITSENITVNNLNVKYINGFPYIANKCGNCNTGYYIPCPDCDYTGPDICDCGNPCDSYVPEPDVCDCYVPCNTGCSPGPTGPKGDPGLNFYTNYTITTITSSIGGSSYLIPHSTTDPNYYNVYQVDTTNGPLTINLPLISNLDNNQRRVHYIVDSVGQLSNNNLIISATGGNTIGGESSATIVVDYSSVQIMSNTIDKWLII